MVFTAVLAAIAVIAAMVTVPGGNATAEESQPSDFEVDDNLAGTVVKDFPWDGIESSWGTLTYAGASEFTWGNDQNDAGWAWH